MPTPKQRPIEEMMAEFRELNKEMMWVAEEEVDSVVFFLHQKLLADIQEMEAENSLVKRKELDKLLKSVL